ncbi:MAG TPA: YkvA family protein [Thermomicrobiales bacterium]|jgi:hypothetical protein|nr:YkvA family protein [Thermomicrobiales bacterium]
MKIFLPLLALVYLISPIDLIPDFLLGAGQLDDFTVILLVGIVLSRLARWAPAEIVNEHLTNLLHRSGTTPGHADGAGGRADGVIDADFRVVEGQDRPRNQRERAGAAG